MVVSFTAAFGRARAQLTADLLGDLRGSDDRGQVLVIPEVPQEPGWIQVIRSDPAVSIHHL